MGSFSNYLENALLNHTFKGSTFTQPANLYLALSTADPGEAGGSIVEPTGINYARVLANSWSTSTTGAINNTATYSFNSAGGPWGTITHYAIFDATGGGNMLAYSALNVSKTITQGDIVQFTSGSLTIRLD